MDMVKPVSPPLQLRWGGIIKQIVKTLKWSQKYKLNADSISTKVNIILTLISNLVHTEQHWLVRQAHDQKIGYPNNLKEEFEDTKGAIRIHISKIWFDLWCVNATISSISAISWRPVLVVEEATVPGENHRPGAETGKLDHLRLRVECTLFCNSQSWARTHAVLVIGLHEQLDPTT